MSRNLLGVGIKPMRMGYTFGHTKSPNTRKPIGKPLRDQVWLKYMGNKAQGKCYCCRIKLIYFSDFHVGHNRAVSKGGKNHIMNLRPICSMCNRGMGTKSIEWYRKKHFAKPKTKVKKTKTKKSKKKFNDPFGWPMTKPPKLSNI